jgi:hypothetical protein
MDIINELRAAVDLAEAEYFDAAATAQDDPRSAEKLKMATTRLNIFLAISERLRMEVRRQMAA